jgi:hypothetical protein
MPRRYRQLRVRDPDTFLLLPATPLAHRHTQHLCERLIPAAGVGPHARHVLKERGDRSIAQAEAGGLRAWIEPLLREEKLGGCVHIK